MGNFEKLIVLTVLFLSAIVLAVSLNTRDPIEAGDGSPLGAARRAGGEPGAPATALDGERETRRPVLSSEVVARTGGDGDPPRGMPSKGGRGGSGEHESSPDRVRGARPTVPPTFLAEPPRILRSRVGLVPTVGDDSMLYRCAQGDTWASLADRFYGDRRFVDLLRGANEDLERPAAGEPLLVPIFDFRAEAGAPARGPAPRHGERTAGPMTTGVTTGESAPAVAPGETYVVRPGDNLTSISLRVYGTITRWSDIFEANREALSHPDRLQVGMELVMPIDRVARVEASSAPTEPSSGEKPRVR